MAMKILLITCVAICSLISSTSAMSGKATYYTTYTPSACFGDQGQGNQVAAVNPTIFNSEDVCGKVIQVKCTDGKACKNSNKVEVKIVNVCPPDICPGDTDICLSKEAYTQIADINSETISVDFN